MEAQVKGPRRPRKHDHEGGSHGGSWKVAYADFVTAMMAFFLLLWLLSMSSTQQKARLAYYFKTFSIFEKSGTSMMDFSKDHIKDFEIIESDPGGKGKEEGSGERTEAEAEKNIEVKEVVVEEINKEELLQRIKTMVELKLANVKNQVLVDVFEGGVRVQVVDDADSLIFPLGSTSLTPKAKEILKAITDNVKNVTGRIAIEGHTDARPYPSQDYTNWELSTARASAARREMGHYGLDPARIVRVTGYAAVEPLIKNDPFDPRNRRISILITVPSQTNARDNTKNSPKT